MTQPLPKEIEKIITDASNEFLEGVQTPAWVDAWTVRIGKDGAFHAGAAFMWRKMQSDQDKMFELFLQIKDLISNDFIISDLHRACDEGLEIIETLKGGSDE